MADQDSCRCHLTLSNRRPGKTVERAGTRKSPVRNRPKQKIVTSEKQAMDELGGKHGLCLLIDIWKKNGSTKSSAAYDRYDRSNNG